MKAYCRACATEVEHCHGTVVHHGGRRPECTEDGCTAPDIAHAFSIDCGAIGCLCVDFGARAAS